MKKKMLLALALGLALSLALCAAAYAEDWYFCPNCEKEVSVRYETNQGGWHLLVCAECGRTSFSDRIACSGTAATCTTRARCATCGGEYGFVLGHNWDENDPVWTWSADYATATVTVTCANDAAHKLSLKAREVDNETTAPTCTANGKIVYTARAYSTVEGLDYRNEKTVVLPALGHAWGAVWAWAEDYSAASVTLTCARDASHQETVPAAVTSETTAPACTADGKIVYTAKATYKDANYTDVKTVVLPATGHAWGAPVWTWAGASASATFTCANDASHPATVTAAVTDNTTEHPTCTADGVGDYYAEVTFAGTKYESTSQPVLPALGHDYRAVVTDADCGTRGCTTHTCARCGDAYTDAHTAARVHWYGEWTSNGDGTHSAACLRACGHTGTAACAYLEATAGETLLTVCPVCGEYGPGAFAPLGGAAVEAVDSGALPRGELSVRGQDAPAGGVLYAFTLSFEYAGAVEPFAGAARVSLPLDISQRFILVRADAADERTELPFAYENGVLTFETDAAGLFLLLLTE